MKELNRIRYFLASLDRSEIKAICIYLGVNVATVSALIHNRGGLGRLLTAVGSEKTMSLWYRKRFKSIRAKWEASAYFASNS